MFAVQKLAQQGTVVAWAVAAAAAAAGVAATAADAAADGQALLEQRQSCYGEEG